MSRKARAGPAVSVVVPSHERPLRLRWLLNALEEQTLSPERWEVVVVFDDAGDEAERALAEHQLAVAGRLRRIRLEPGTGSPSRQRNTGWRAARGRLIAFTDDDCRPEATWLEELLTIASQNEGAIVQGATRPDPFEADVIGMAPRVRTLTVDPPGPFAQTCNIMYPRDVLTRAGGFDEAMPTAAGEDTDLALRARALGVAYVAAPKAVVNHAVEAYSLPAMMRLAWKWQHLPYVVARHPEVRRLYPLRVFWRGTHAAFIGGVLGAAVARRKRVAPLAFMPYASMLLPGRAEPLRRWPRAVVELPGRALVDLAELAALVAGSARYRTLFL